MRPNLSQHYISPLDALKECLRVTRNGGTVLLVEPYVSFLSYIPYKLFHHGDTSWRYTNTESVSLGSDLAGLPLAIRVYPNILLRSLVKLEKI